MTQGPGRQEPSVGSVAEEAAKLLGALRGLAGDAAGEAAAAAAPGLAGELGSLSDHLGHGPDCRYCPVCQGIRRVRDLSPEVREHLAVALGSLAQAATAALRGDDVEPDERTEDSAPHKVDLDDD